MIKENYMLYQGPFAENGCLYTMELSKPYSASNTKDSAKSALTALAPEDIALGSKAKFISEDVNGSRYEWIYEWEQNVEEEKLFMLVAETYIDRAPNGEVVPEGKLNITSTAEVDVYNYAKAQVVDANLVAGNIKEDVQILGVTGSYSGGGGVNFPTLVNDDSTPPAVFSVDMTYAQVKAYVLEYADDNGLAPLLAHYILSNDSYYQWEDARFIDSENIHSYIGVPENVTEGVDLAGVLYGSDENFYQLGD